MVLSRYVGAVVKRKEDPRLITGSSTYVDDIKIPGTLHVAFVRSQYPHALINGIDAGTVALNSLPTFDPRLPVRGSKRSGYGRELGGAGIREFLQAKTVVIGQ